MTNSITPASLSELVQALISGQGYTLQEALDCVAELKEEVASGMDPEEALQEVGLEPDYIFDLIDF